MNVDLQSPVRSAARRQRRQAHVAFALAMAAAITVPAISQWSSTVLNPLEGSSSRAQMTMGPQQVGWIMDGGPSHAALWNATASSWVSLHPDGAGSSVAYWTSGAEQAGQVSDHAGVWHGSAASWIDLHPLGADDSAGGNAGGDSAAWFTDGVHQSGMAYFNGVRHGGFWSGSAASWVDLHPAGASWSHVAGIDGEKQVGHARFAGADHAGIWSGTPESWTALTPANAISSAAGVIGHGRQGGWVSFGGPIRASIWNGTPESWIDLTPQGTTGHAEVLHGVGHRQVGYATFSGAAHAGLWSGTASSWFDLNAVLGGSYSNSLALGISECDGTLYVTGVAWTNANNPVAVLWTGPARRCAADLDGDGSVGAADLAILLGAWGPCP
ncbi:MAG: hypothetical protein KDA25_08165 [Phycisphaerales bacterium]|nr:hypothetical protein [Phycisphaerales bacterium]